MIKHHLFLKRVVATAYGNSLIFTAALREGESNLFLIYDSKRFAGRTCKITVSGKPNIFNYCVIFILHIIHKCGRGPRVGHG